MSFKEINGQDKVITLLKGAIQRQRIAHAYLFTGPSGIGKMEMAKNFVKAINCEQGSVEPCDGCISCRKIDNLNHPDVNWIEKEDGVQHIKIEQIRQLKKYINLKPYEAKMKVWVITEADAMTEEASNCLLKTLEEPQGQAVLILMTSNMSKLLPTIVSRCQVINFLSSNILTVNKGYDKNKVIDEFLESMLWDELLSWKDRDRIGEVLDIFISWYRDILVLKSGGDVSMIINKEREGDISSSIDNYTFKTLEENIRLIYRTQDIIRRNANQKIALIAMQIGLCEKKIENPVR